MVRTRRADYFFLTKVKEIRFQNMKFFLYIICFSKRTQVLKVKEEKEKLRDNYSYNFS